MPSDFFKKKIIGVEKREKLFCLISLAFYSRKTNDPKEQNQENSWKIYI